MSREEQFARDLTSENETPENPLEAGQKSGGGLGTFADLKGFQKLIAERKGAVSEQIAPVDPSEVHEPGIQEARAQAIDRINKASAKAEADLRAVIGDIDAGWDAVSVPVNTDTLDAGWDSPANDGGVKTEAPPLVTTDRRTMRGMFARGGDSVELASSVEKISVKPDDVVMELSSTDRRTLRGGFVIDRTEDADKSDLSTKEPIEVNEEPYPKTVLGHDTLSGGFEAPKSTEVDVVEEGGTLKGLGIPKDLDLVSGLLTASGVLALTKLLQKNGISEENWNKINPFDRKQVEKIQKEIEAQEERIEKLKQEKQKIKMAARAEVGYKVPLSKEVQIQMQEKDREIASIEALILKNRNQQEMILRKPLSAEIVDIVTDDEEKVKPSKIEEYVQEAPEPKSSWWKNSPRFRKVATGAGMVVGAGLIAGAWLGAKVIKNIFRPFKITEMFGNGVYHFFNFLERSIVKGDPLGALSDAANGAGKFFEEKMKKTEEWVNKKPEKKS